MQRWVSLIYCLDPTKFAEIWTQLQQVNHEKYAKMKIFRIVLAICLIRQSQKYVSDQLLTGTKKPIQNPFFSYFVNSSQLKIDVSVEKFL